MHFLVDIWVTVIRSSALDWETCKAIKRDEFWLGMDTVIAGMSSKKALWYWHDSLSLSLWLLEVLSIHGFKARKGLFAVYQLNRTELHWTDLNKSIATSYIERLLVMRTVQRVNVTSHFIFIGYRHSSELGRLLLNMCIPNSRTHWRFSQTAVSSVQFISVQSIIRSFICLSKKGKMCTHTINSQARKQGLALAVISVNM